jgi:hypothetical protein
MSLVRPAVWDNNLDDRRLMPGDLMAGSDNILAGGISTVGSGTWTGAAIATGIINRTGPTGAYTDTTDSAANIVAALKGNNNAVDIVPGTSFRMILRNTVAFALTWAAGTGVVSGTGTLDVAASTVREYIVTVLNAGNTQIIQSATTNGSATVTFVLPVSGQVALPQNITGPGYDIQPGMSVTGTGIAAGAYVLGVTQGVGGITGITLSANATATSSSVALTFGPRVQFDGLRSSDL